MKAASRLMVLALVVGLVLAFGAMTVAASGVVTNLNTGVTYGTIQDAIDAATPGDTITVGPGTYVEDLDIAKSVAILGSGIDVTIVDASGLAGHNSSAIYVHADNVVLEGMTVNGGSVGTPRYGVKVGEVDTIGLSAIKSTGMYRSGFDLLGSSNVTLVGLLAVGNGGHGLSLCDVNGVSVTGLTSQTNGWSPVSIVTWGRYSPIGTSGVVFNLPLVYGGVFQLENGRYPAGPALMMSYSTSIADGADVTVPASLFEYAMYGADDEAPTYQRVFLFADWATAAAAAELPNVGHLVGDYALRSIADQTQWTVPSDSYGSIQTAIDWADPGDTINVASGTYVENILVDKHVDIIGAGSGADDTTNTIFTANTTVSGDTKVGVVQLDASGDSAADPILFQDLRVEPVGMAGFSVGRFTEATGTSVSHVWLDNVHVVGTNISPSTEQERGLYVDKTSSLTGLVVTDSAFDNLTYGWYLMKDVSADVSNVSDVTVTNTSFNHNNHKGVYAEKLSDATFTGCEVDDNGYDSSILPSYFQAWSCGVDLNLKAGTYVNISFIDCTMDNNATDEAKEGAALMIKGRDDGTSYGAFPATLDNVLVQGGSYTNNERGIRAGEPGKNNATPTNVVIRGATFTGNTQRYSGADGSAYGAVINACQAQVDARGNWFVTDDPALIAPEIAGDVDWTPWLMATPATTLYGTNDSIQDAIDFCAAGDTITVWPGTYNESLDVTKGLTLKGDAATMPVVDAGGADFCVVVNADGVTLDGLWIKGAEKDGVLSQDRSNLTVKKCKVSDVGALGTTTSGSNCGIAVVCSAAPVDNVTIEDNIIFAIDGPDYVSASGVTVGWSNGDEDVTNLSIQRNEIYDIDSSILPWKAGHGAYGVLLNHANGASYAGKTVAAQVKDNVIYDLEGLWAHGIGLEGNLPDAVVTGNDISDLTDHKDPTDAAAIMVEDNASAASMTISQNSFTNLGVGVTNVTGILVNAEYNYWDAASGPATVGPGSGVYVSYDVDYSPWYGDAAMTWTASESASGAIEIPADMDRAQANAIIADAPYGATILLLAGNHAGGLNLTAPGVTIIAEPGAVLGHGSDGLNVFAADITLQGLLLDGTGCSLGDAGIRVSAGADNLAILDCDIWNWSDGVYIGASPVSFKMIGNFVYRNMMGLVVGVNAGPTGVVTIEGNLFKANSDRAVAVDGTNPALDVAYNSWGIMGSPAAMITGPATYTPWTYAEPFMDMVPDTEATQVEVNESETFVVKLKVDAAELTGLTFKLNYDTDYMTLQSKTFAAPFAGNETDLDAAPVDGQENYRIMLMSPASGDGMTVVELEFLADGGTGNGTWEQYFDISHVEAETSAAATGGVKVFVNNAGYGLPSDPARDVTDAIDGKVLMNGIANYTGFIDLQGRADDSGATVSVSDLSVLKASATSVSSGAWTSVHEAGELLVIGETYDIIIDAPLYLPTTVKAEVLTDRPLTDLALCKLLGGDANDDDYIDIGDITLIGGNYGLPASGASNPNADVNADSLVDILDLVLAAGNYELGESPWTP